jgi:hypothetical protein
VNDLVVEIKTEKWQSKPRKIQPTFLRRGSEQPEEKEEERGEIRNERRRERREEGGGNEVTEFGLFGVGFVWKYGSYAGLQRVAKGQRPSVF